MLLNNENTVFLGIGRYSICSEELNVSSITTKMLLCQKKIYDVLKQRSGVETIQGYTWSFFKTLKNCKHVMVMYIRTIMLINTLMI